MSSRDTWTQSLTDGSTRLLGALICIQKKERKERRVLEARDFFPDCGIAANGWGSTQGLSRLVLIERGTSHLLRFAIRSYGLARGGVGYSSIIVILL